MEKINTVAGALEKLNVKLGGVEGEINPKMQKVEALKKIYATLGGASEDVDELSTTYELVSKIADVAEGGGGNPNSVQVITGTLDAPWGDVDLTELASAVYSSNASFVMELDLSILGITTPVEIASSPVQLTSNLAASLFRVNDSGELANAIYVSWVLTAGNELHSAWANYGGAITRMTDYASQIPTTLTIYWHPMPEAEGE